MKKFINAVLVAVLLLGSILAMGCGKESEVVTVKFSYPPFGYDSAKEEAFWSKYIAQFEAENPNIKIEMTWESWNSGQPFSKWEQAMAAGDTPDIAYASPRNVIDYAQRGKLLPLTDVVKDLGGDSAFSAGMRYFKYNDEWYAVPNCDATQILMYRKDILKAAGYDNPPTTWDELVEIAQACTGNGTYGLAFYTCDQYYVIQTVAGFMKAAGGDMLNDNGELVFNSPENIEGLQFFSDLIHTYEVVPPDSIAWLYGDLVNGLGTGEVAMIIEWGGYATLMESMFPNAYQNIGYAKIPVGPSGISGGWQGAGGFFMFKDAKHPDEAKEFIEFMSRPDISEEWCIASGNVAPFLSVLNDPDLLALDWYKAVSEQVPNSITMGWDYGIVPGSAECATPFQNAVQGVISGSVTPEEALETLQEQCQEFLDRAAQQ